MATPVVIADSTTSLPPEMYGRYGIIMVPYYVHLGERSLRDTVDILPAEFNAYLLGLPDGADLPTTAHPGPEDYMRAFRAASQRSDKVISFHMTSLGSGAYDSALVAIERAADELPGLRIRAVDTQNVSMCHGWLALHAARLAAQGADLDDLVAETRRLLPHTRMIQTADTLRYLYMGGRIGRAKHLVGSLLRIKPLISMEEGRIVVLGVARSRSSAYRRMVSLLEEAVGHGARVRLALTHAAAREDAESVLALAREVVEPEEVLFCDLCPALTVHSGPGTVGLCYLQIPGDAGGS